MKQPLLQTRVHTSLDSYFENKFLMQTTNLAFN